MGALQKSGSRHRVTADLRPRRLVPEVRGFTFPPEPERRALWYGGRSWHLTPGPTQERPVWAAACGLTRHAHPSARRLTTEGSPTRCRSILTARRHPPGAKSIPVWGCLCRVSWYSSWDHCYWSRTSRPGPLIRGGVLFGMPPCPGRGRAAGSISVQRDRRKINRHQRDWLLTYSGGRESASVAGLSPSDAASGSLVIAISLLRQHLVERRARVIALLASHP
jgi:hypothetical protein